MKHKIYAMMTIATISMSWTSPAGAKLIINELMQSNIDCIMDDINEYPDSWVELYNPGQTVEKLNEYSLGDSKKSNKAYQLPSVDINPGEFIVIYCDKVGTGLHTNFRLDSGKGGAVYLFYQNEIIDQVEEWKKQPAPNIAYGRILENNDEWGYQAQPTPGASNCGNICKDILSEPMFSVGGKVFTEPFSLALDIPNKSPEGTIIRYTLDCTEPTASSPIYSEPFDISETTVVRAKLFCEGWLSPRSTTNSYISHPREMTLPLVSIVSDNRYFYDGKKGILVEGDYTPGTPNYEYDWRRPTNYELFENVDSESVINQLCETRVKGGGSRKLPLKSMVFYANKRFGTKRFNYEFFPDETPGINEFKSFEMRNSGDDFNTTYMRDAIIQKSMGMNCDLDWQPSQPTIVYINGIYKGILNVRPRSNEDYVYSYYDGLEDLDMIENWNQLKEGSKDNLEAFKKFYAEEGHSYAEYEEWMDVEEFCNYMIMNIFFDNKDFPGNNIVMWRPTEEGGKWRWVAKDTDFGLGLYSEPYDYQTLFWITTPGYDNDHNSWANGEAYTLLFRHLLDTEEFRKMFIDKCAVYLGDFLTAEQIKALIDKRHDELQFEYDFHRKNMGDHHSKFSENVDMAKEWIENRIPSFYNQVASFFNLENPIPLKIKSESSADISVNGINLRNQEYNGRYFPKQRLFISASNPEEAATKSAKWIVRVSDNNQTNSISYDTPTLDIEMPYGQNVEVEHIWTDDSHVEGIFEENDLESKYEIYDISGRRIKSGNSSSLSSLPSGVYIMSSNNKTKKITVNQ